MSTRRQFVLGSAAGLVCAGAAPFRQALAQVKTARLVVGAPPGGVADGVARNLAEGLRGSYAPNVIVDNRPGAGLRIAVEVVKASEGDGATMLVTPNPMITIYPHVYRKLSYDPLRDLTAVTSLGDVPLMLVAGPGLPGEVQSVAALVRWAGSNPAKASFGTSAAGSTLHFIGATFARAAGIELTHVAYKGGGPVVQDLLGGQIPLGVMTSAAAMPQVQAGKLRAIAITGTERSPLLPNVPTFRESGYPSITMKDWVGLFVPASTPAHIVTRLNATTRAALKSSELTAAFAKLLIEPAGESPEECAKRVQDEHAMWGPIVKASGFTVED
jgi:tripartite-type tricarboxylate transporter receptor subunit TctC